MDLLGILYEISPTETRTFTGSDGQPREYTFCEVVVDCSEYNKMTGERYENLVPVLFSGKALDALRNIAIGSRVKVAMHPKGGSFTPPEGGSPRRYVRLKAWDIKVTAAPPQAPTTPAPPLPSTQVPPANQPPAPPSFAPQDSDPLPF